MKRTARTLGLCLLGVGLAFAPLSGADDGKHSCIAAYEEGQRLRNKGDFVRALDQFAFCDSPQCPAVMQTDCGQWLSQVQASLPTAVFRAVDSMGLAVPGAFVSVDGRPPQALDGRALAINPGAHVVVVEHPHYRRVSLPIFVSEGEKLKLYDFTLTPAKPPSPLPPTTTVGGSPFTALDAAPSAQAPRSRPVLAIGLTSAIAMLGGAGFAYFGLRARSADRELDACAPFCERAAVDGVKRDYLIANVSIGIGLIGAATAALLLLLPANTSRSSGLSALPPAGPVLPLGSTTRFQTAF